MLPNTQPNLPLVSLLYPKGASQPEYGQLKFSVLLKQQ
jgi:hypothetical protein